MSTGIVFNTGVVEETKCDAFQNKCIPFSQHV